MLTVMKRSIAILACVVALAGCNSRIPNKVSSDEYGIYSEWVNAHFSKRAPSNLYISTRTFVFDPVSRTDGCKSTEMVEKAGAPSSLIKQLHALGEAEYPLDVDSPNSQLRIAWKYEASDHWQLLSEENLPFQFVGFSRVAFNRAHTEALFAVTDICGGVCGWGDAVHARKESGTWVFENGGCDWEY